MDLALRPSEVDLTRPDTFVRIDPVEFWETVRHHTPVYWHDATPSTSGFWVVSRHADVQACYANSAALSSERGTVLDVLLRGDDSAGGRMLAVTDGARHRALRSVLLRAFSPRVLDSVTAGVKHRVQGLVERLVGAGPVDFATAVADVVPISTICDLLSIPAADRPSLLRWNKLALSSEGPSVTENESTRARNQIVGYFVDLAEERQDHPGDDVVSLIASASIDGEPLSVIDIALNCYSLILGGDESSRVSAIGAVIALASFPEQWELVRSGAVDPNTVVEEVLRWVTPAMHFARTAVTDLDIDGHAVRSGDIVSMWNTSANFDETVFDNPRMFQAGRHPNKHLSLGYGQHFCLGAHLGRAELRSLIEVLVRSVRGIEIVEPPRPIYSNFLAGFSSAVTRFS